MLPDDDGLPVAGAPAHRVKLTARKRKIDVLRRGKPNQSYNAYGDIPVITDSNGNGEYVEPGTGGMSVTIPPHIRENCDDDAVLYECKVSDIEKFKLQFVQDKEDHGVIEPKEVMTYQEFLDELEKTRKYWKRSSI